MEDKSYYAMLYEPIYPDAGVVVFKPVKLAKGSYDVEKDIFVEDGVNEVYSSVGITIPVLGLDEDYELNPLNHEMESDVEDEKFYFGFPVDEATLIEYGDDDFEAMGVEKDEIDYLELYEREIRSYFLYSVYSKEIDDTLFFAMDKFDDEKIYNIDVSLDIARAIGEAEENYSQNQMTLVVTNKLSDNREFMDLEVDKEPNIQSKEKIANDIIFDFDPDKLEENIKAEVIAQDHVATALVSMLYKNKRYHEHDGLKSNMLILGPSGCGKTELARAVARHLNIPITVFDATSATASGFVGSSVSQCIRDLIQVCNGDIKKAEHGIIVIDEIDKLAQKGTAESINKGDVQNELFKLLEGDEITIASESYKDQSFRFNPKNITFICIGSAQELIDSKRKNKKENQNKRTIGFNPQEKVAINDDQIDEEEIILEPKDLMEFGLKPELLRRLPVIKVVKQLSKNDLVSILTDSKISNLKLYEKAFQDVDNVKLVYNNEVLETVAEKATKEKAGASGLKRVVDDMLQTAVRKIRLLQGAPGELVLLKETVDNPDKFELYKLEEQNKVLVYPPKEKVKTLGTKN